MTLEFDAVVVGAGHNGLATAVHLASRGWSVAVVEKASAPGGAVKTAEATLPGFRHDLYAMNLSMFAGSPFFVDGSGANTLRLNFSKEDAEKLREGVARLARAVRSFASRGAAVATA